MANTTNKKPWGYGNYITYSEEISRLHYQALQEKVIILQQH